LGAMALLGHDVHHSTLGIIGCGRIGLEIARRAKGFNMQVLYYDKVRRKPTEEREFGSNSYLACRDCSRGQTS